MATASSKYLHGLLNLATVTATIGGLTAVIGRVRGDRHPETVLEPLPVDDWKTYSEEGRRLGPVDARVIRVMFLDFQCPYCRSAARDLQTLRHDHPRDVAVVYRHFPLTIIHPRARVAALAAACGAREGVFEDLHDRLYDQPDSIGLKPWTRFVLEAGVTDTTRFVSCMDGAEAKAALSRDSVAAVRLGVVATPTLLINELKFEGHIGLKRLKASVATALKRSRP